MKHAKLPVINRSINSCPVWYQNNWIDNPISEQRSEFIAHKLSKSSDYSPKLCYSISNIPFNDFTEHRQNYIDKNKNYNKSFLRRRDQIQLSKLPMESISIYNDEYKLKESVKTNPVKPHASQIDFVFNNSENTVDTMSSLYKSDFQTWDKEETKKVVKFKENLIDNQNASTDYQENFQKKPPTRIIMPYPSYKKPTVPFASATSYNLTFIRHPYSKEAIIHPMKSNLSLENQPFSGQSLYKSDFVEKERDIELDDLNILQNPSSFSQKIQHESWFDRYPGQEFNDYRDHIFYRK